MIFNADGIPFIDDFDAVTDPKYGRGRVERDFAQVPRGSLPGGRSAHPMLSIAEIREIIEEKDRTKTRTMDLCDAAGVPIMDQGYTNFCWCYAPVKGMAIQRMKQGEPYVELSPESMAGPISNYANANGSPVGVGGYGIQALTFAVGDGPCSRRLWAKHRIARSMNTAEVQADRKNYRGAEFYDLGYDNLQGLYSCVALGMPVALGVNAWRHEILVIDLMIDPRTGDICGIFDNSYGAHWGTKGRGVIRPSLMRGDGVVIATMTGGSSSPSQTTGQPMAA